MSEKKIFQEKSLIVIPKVPVNLPKHCEGRVEEFLTIIQCLNEGLEDERLDYPEPTFYALKELQDFNAIQGRQCIPYFNLRKGPDGVPLMYYEV